MVATSLYERPSAPIVDEVELHLELFTEDFDRLWSAPEPVDEAPLPPKPITPSRTTDDAAYEEVRDAVQRAGRCDSEGAWQGEDRLCELAEAALPGKRVKRDFVRDAIAELFGKPGRSRPRR
jgi:hypothetical protein